MVALSLRPSLKKIIDRSFLPSLLLAVFLNAGCSHYRLGQPTKLPFRTLYVVPVANNSYAPQVQVPLTNDIVQSFLRDGTVQITKDKHTADVVLAVTISDYKRNVSTTREDDTFLARSYDVTLEAECTLTDQRTDKVYFENRNVSATNEVFFDSGFQSDEYQDIPKLTRELGREVRDLVLSNW